MTGEAHHVSHVLLLLEDKYFSFLVMCLILCWWDDCGDIVFIQIAEKVGWSNRFVKEKIKALKRYAEKDLKPGVEAEIAIC